MLVPSWVNNYGLALTPIRFFPFVIATLVGSPLPIIQNVNLGTAMGSIASLVAAEKKVAAENNTQADDDMSQWTRPLFMTLGIVSTLVLSRMVQKAVSSELQAHVKGPLIEDEGTIKK